jgi:hypothetical protein
MLPPFLGFVWILLIGIGIPYLWVRAARALGNLEKKSRERALQRERERERDADTDERKKEEKQKQTVKNDWIREQIVALFTNRLETYSSFYLDNREFLRFLLSILV